MDFSYWLDAYQVCVKPSQQALVALESMGKAAKSFSDCFNVFYRAPIGSSIEEVALSRMEGLATTFGNWSTIFYCATPSSDLEAKALLKLICLADDPKDIDWTADVQAIRWRRLLEVHAMCAAGSDEEKKIASLIMAALDKKKKKPKRAVLKM